MMKADLFSKIYSDALEVKDSIESKNLNEELRCLEERYEIKSLIGEGAVKKVFLAFDKMMDREVALAKIKPESQDQINDFINEARLSSNLEHPYIAPVYDLGFDAEDNPFFVMKLYDGRNLREELLARKDKNLELQNEITWILNIYLKVCEAVSFAHSKGVLHLDIKPSNIRINDHGEVMLCDWGIARYLHSAEDTSEFDFTVPENVLSRATLTGQVRGTPGFMAPEQKSKDCQFDERTDIYGLGALLHDMLTGQPDLLHKENESIPLELRAICRKALSEKQEMRYQNVNKLIEDLNKFQSGQVTTAENANLLLVLKKWSWRHRKAISLTLANLIIFGTLIFIYIRDMKKGKENLQTAVNELKIKEAEQKKADIERAKNYYLRGFDAYCNAVSEFDFDAGDIRLAKTLLEKSTQLNPADKEAWALLGSLKLNRNEYKSSINDFKKAGNDYEEYVEAIERNLPSLKAKTNKDQALLNFIQEITNFDNYDQRLRNHLIFKGLHNIPNPRRLFSFSMGAMKIVNHLTDMNYTYDPVEKYLNLSNNNIRILYPLKTLRIKRLNISHNPMWDNEFYNLRRIPLTHLDASYCKITQMKRFGNTEIEVMNLEGNPLADIKPLTETAIKELNIAFSKVNLEQVSKCKHLEKVICSEDQYEELKKLLNPKVKIEVKKRDR